MLSRLFHPAVASWFNETFATPTPCQEQAWPAIKAGNNTLIAAPTGSGKTLAAFLAALDNLVRAGGEEPLADVTQVVYISPLKALSNDVHRNLEQPLEGIRHRLAAMGYADICINAFVRTGDTPTAARTAMTRKPPHIVVTTPESFYILLSSDSGRRMLKTVRTVIVDEIHAVVGSKRGSHLALSLERLDRLTDSNLIRIGLSATQRPLEEVGRFLVGDPKNRSQCAIVDTRHDRLLDIDIITPNSPLEALLSGQAASELYDKLAALVVAHKTTLIFVNTRRMAERVARYLSERIGEENVTSHHGSLAREQRLSAETRLKAGDLRALVATASLELGIDIGDIELVCQIGTTRSISALLQRVGRSGHYLGGVPKGRLFPTSRDELIECIALIEAIRGGELDRLCIPLKPKDVLAQQIVAMVASEDWNEKELLHCVRKAYPYRHLDEDEFTAITKMLANGFSTQRGQRGAHIHRDIINQTLKARRGARLTAITCGGAIPDNADYRIILEPSGEFIGSVDEDFAMESLTGDIFQLGNNSWRVLRLERGELKVEDARNQPPTIPFWFGEAPGRTSELSRAVSCLREDIAKRCESPESDNDSARRWLQQETGIDRSAADQAVHYIAAAKLTLGVIPSHKRLVIERFFDESGGMQLILHAPFGNRINRAWGLALRKCFCRTFNFELQAAATEDAIILSLGTSQSFPLADVAQYLNTKSVKNVLIQAVLDAPMFTVRWRWNVTCALAVRRFQNGKKTPPYLIRMQSDDLVTSVFPEQTACLENLAGDREIPDHPLVEQTLKDCLTEAMDVDGLIGILEQIQNGVIEVVARDVVEPSPLAAEILTANNYAFLDGAPAEERRTRAVTSRRWLNPQEASDLGRLDPEAITRVRMETWPQVTNADELSDALTTVGFIDPKNDQTSDWQGFFDELAIKGRATRLTLIQRLPNSDHPESEEKVLWVSAERLPQFRAIYPDGDYDPSLQLPDELNRQDWQRDQALIEVIRSRLAVCGPVQPQLLAEHLALDSALIQRFFETLENEGYVLRGHFSGNGEITEWCERRLLARIHRYTIKSLRKQIEPVCTADFMRFLFRWQRLHPDYRMKGAEALTAIVKQVEGFETSASAWEGDIFGARIDGFEIHWLDDLCRSGKVIWSRLSPAANGVGPIKSSPLAFFPRRHWNIWHALQPPRSDPKLTSTSQCVFEILSSQGALFFDELQDQSRLLKTHLEESLAELVMKGLISCDSFLGLRIMLLPEQKKRGRLKPLFNMEDAGRWAVLKKQTGQVTDSERVLPQHQETGQQLKYLEHSARVLLNRYGVIFRALLTRESLAPAWYDLLHVYRRLEDRDEVRGGRFVSAQYGEQFALPEAVEALRKVRKEQDDSTYTVVNASDPLNLVGIVMPGGKITAHPGTRILFQGGVAVAFQSGKEFRYLKTVDEKQKWNIEQKLVRQNYSKTAPHPVHQSLTRIAPDIASYSRREEGE